MKTADSLKNERDVRTKSCENVLRCEGVTHTYANGVEANRGIDLELNAGDVLCLVGPNGAGKTTLVRQIAGELRPTRGRILVCGLDVVATPRKAIARMGIIPQQTSLFDGLTVAQHLYYFGRLKGLGGPKLKMASDYVITELELEELLKRRAGQLSGGERRAVLLALAMLANPSFLLLDEPSVGLDPEARHRVWSALRRQRDQGRAILLTTHYLDEAETLADTVGFVVAGRLARLGSVSALSASVGKRIRLSWDSSGDQVEYFNDMSEAERFVQERNLTTYSVSPTNLWDLYASITAEGLRDAR